MVGLLMTKNEKIGIAIAVVAVGGLVYMATRPGPTGPASLPSGGATGTTGGTTGATGATGPAGATGCPPGNTPFASLGFSPVQMSQLGVAALKSIQYLSSNSAPATCSGITSYVYNPVQSQVTDADFLSNISAFQTCFNAGLYKNYMKPGTYPTLTVGQFDANTLSMLMNVAGFTPSWWTC